MATLTKYNSFKSMKQAAPSTVKKIVTYKKGGSRDDNISPVAK